MTRSPIGQNCQLGEPRVAWPPGYLDRYVPPTIWGSDGILGAVLDVDPVYDHPNPTPEGWEFQVYGSDDDDRYY